MTDVDTCAVLDARLDPVIALLRDMVRGSTGDGEALIALSDDKPVVELRWRGELHADALARANAMVADDSRNGSAR